ncbi:hypothetical protein L210DRAFT_3114504 [Boletus edulis BED1]|uniref:Uncharacterized protein n=1 Tax=Boletus edulis BED1 TaxID=1328754 RepID=A0AAD4G8Q0_BOLED|nr:hypothetical protein L210DRAFT_3114504 [Boletus edulis BED1]
MVHWWDDPSVEAHLGVIYVDFAFFLLGIHGWEYFRSFGIEYAIIRGRLPWRWPLVPYLLGRLFLLTLLLLLAVGMSPFSGPFTCQSGAVWIAISGAIAIVHLLLLLLSLGHWSVLALDTVNIKSFRSNGACTIYLMHPAVSAGVFVYTMCYDFLVFVLSIIKLSERTMQISSERVFALARFIVFCCSGCSEYSTNGFCFHWSSRYVDELVTAITASTIVSSRAVRSLLGLRTACSSHVCDGNIGNDPVLTTQLPDQTSIVSTGMC